MDKLVIKIERKHLQLAQVGSKAARTYISKVRRFDLPPDLCDRNKIDSPLDLAKFIREKTIDSGIACRRVVILFDSSVAVQREYRCEKNSSRKHDAFMTKAKEIWDIDTKNLIIENFNYGTHVDPKGMNICALYAIDSLFIRNFTMFMKERGFKIEYAGPAMLAYSETAGRLLRDIYAEENLRGKNVIAIDIEDHYLRLSVFVNENLYHQNEMEIDAADEDEILNYIELGVEFALTTGIEDADLRMDYVFISGDVSADMNFEKRLAGKLNLPCRSIERYYGTTKYIIDLAGELEGRTSLYSRVVSDAGIDVKQKRTVNFIYGGMDKRRWRRHTYYISLAALVIALIAGCILPAYLYFLESERDKNAAIVENPRYEEAREMLAEKNRLNTNLNILTADAGLMKSNSAHYADMLDLISRELSGADISSLKMTDNGKIEVIFTAVDTTGYEAAADRINSEGLYTITETGERTMQPDGTTTYQIEVSIRNGGIGDEGQ